MISVVVIVIMITKLIIIIVFIIIIIINIMFLIKAMGNDKDAIETYKDTARMHPKTDIKKKANNL